MALRTCSYNGLGLDEFIVYAASYYVNAVADTDEVRLVVKKLECLRYAIRPRGFLIPFVSWYCDISVGFKVLKIVFGEAFVAHRNKEQSRTWMGFEVGVNGVANGR